MEKKEAVISWNEFSKVEMRVGTVMQAEVFKEAKKPAYTMIVDFGDLGTRKTSAQITSLYTPDELIGKQVIAVINFPPKQIANLQSECLILGAVEGGEVTLLIPDKPVKDGLRIG
jgi:tRNA-binding protein